MVDEFYAADLDNIDPSSPEVKNLEQFKQWVAEMHADFSDKQITIEDLIAEGDKSENVNQCVLTMSSGHFVFTFSSPL